MNLEYYYYGLAAMLYLVTCWMFAAVRWFHTAMSKYVINFGEETSISEIEIKK